MANTYSSTGLANFLSSAPRLRILPVSELSQQPGAEHVKP